MLEISIFFQDSNIEVDIKFEFWWEASLKDVSLYDFLVVGAAAAIGYLICKSSKLISNIYI